MFSKFMSIFASTVQIRNMWFEIINDIKLLKFVLIVRLFIGSTLFYIFDTKDEASFKLMILSPLALTLPIVYVAVHFSVSTTQSIFALAFVGSLTT